LLARPYEFLQASDKVSIDHDTLGVTAAVRKQVPVLLDFRDGRVYIENSNKKLIYMITVRSPQCRFRFARQDHCSAAATSAANFRMRRDTGCMASLIG
jgi:hypothetical protein